MLHSCRWMSSSKIRHEEARKRVSQLDAEGAAVHFCERDRGGLLEFLFDLLLERAGQRAIVALHVELEVEPKAAGVEVCRTQKRPRAVDHDQLRVVERRGREPHAAAAGQD